ncbi:MAG: methyl-accepting chemotaxis protein [Gallionellaceae bacterium]
MRNNQPISNVEYALKDGVFIVSRTDKLGNIIYCNKDFVDASGYTLGEVMGQPHNILRHPDMPVEAFADFWETLKGGHPWHGLVKNRRKDGSFYWVMADASPVLENGQCVGYVSVRTKPAREDVVAAEALYRQFREGRQGNLKIVHGTAKKPDSSFRKYVPESIGSRLWVAFAVLMAAIILNSAIGYFALKNVNEEFADVANRRVHLAVDIFTIRGFVNDSQMQIMLGLQHDPAGVAASLHDHPASKHLDQIDKDVVDYQQAIAKYEQSVHSTAGKELLADLKGKFEKYRTEGLMPARTALVAGSYVEAQRILLKQILPLMKEVRLAADAVANHEMEGVEKTAQRMEAEMARSNIFILGAIFFSLIVVLGYGYGLIGSIQKNLRRLIVTMQHVVEHGDLTLRVPKISRKDEMGEISTAFNQMMINVGASMYDVKHSALEIQETAMKLADSADEVTRGSRAQSDSASSTAAAVEEVTVSIGMVAENATEVGRKAQQSADLTREGNRNADVMVNDITSIEQVMVAVERSVQEFIERAHSISGMTQQVKDIADQTNLLALNAAIEAARAGEQGRGFAVVADEVRKLAEKSAHSANEIDRITRELDNQSSEVEKSIEQGVQSIQATQRNAQQVSGLMLQAGEAVDRATIGVSDIVNAVQEQKVATDMIANHVEGIAQMAEKNHAAVSDTRDSITTLEMLAKQLRQSSDRFKI